MHRDERDLLEVLKFELNFFKRVDTADRPANPGVHF